ncbi:hypothetical protein B4U80_08517 [Leptotrombidium deliense]|uniref:DNA polymerase n=1 Tax=Leptotrombidium deliense TaxID=299467 RepID=A0A443SN85_9ACAR|nr:hypothetical protein B4U80_08517 [Leptotrombidium deliense]
MEDGDSKVTRNRRAKKKDLSSALAKLKQIRGGDSKLRLDIKEEENVYDMVDEEEYSGIVQKRLEDDWIVDDEGLENYVEDGREIFDEDFDGEEAPRGKKRKNIISIHDEERVPKKNIKNYFMRQQRMEQKVNENKKVDLDKDDFLKQLIGEVNATNDASSSSGDTTASQSLVKPLKLLKKKAAPTNPFETKPVIEELDWKPHPDRRGIDGNPANDAKDKVLLCIRNKVLETEEYGDEIGDKTSGPVFGVNANNQSKSEANYSTPSSNDIINNLDYITEGSEKFVKLYWTDAYDGWVPGTVYIFGKIFVKSVEKYVSCCVVVGNIQRRIHFLSNGDPDDTYKEFEESVAGKYKISKYVAKTVKKFYAFEKEDVPSEADYLEVLYPASNNVLPNSLKGKHFSAVFGTNQSSLERLLLELRVKGPSWIKIRNPVFESVHSSWCKVEMKVESFLDQITVLDDQSIPPLTLMSLKLKTYTNPKLNQKEIIAISCLCNNNYDIESGSASKYDDHFCIVTKPVSSADIILPYDFNTANLSKLSTKTKVFVMGSERELLNFFMAKFGQIDADIVVGHDILNFDLELIFQRLTHYKYGQWSKLGRFKRTELPHKSKNKTPVTAGRLVCDIKLSAKELIRLKDYELTELVAEIMRKSRFEVEQRMLPAFYKSTPQLLKLINFLMVDNEFILSILQELNILPLALQITKIAGNVMSRTLLGGRSERNEFLLLHAFSEKGYIVPDKYGKFSEKLDDKPTVETEDGDKNSLRRKPAYTGGLVLEPKVGFYDQFILLMDFNSLYPSIIQEYNICFTTVTRKKGIINDDEEYIPEEPSKQIEEGILSVEIRKLVESRREVKKLMCQKDLSDELKLRYDVKQKALKLTANSMYGCLGFKNSRFYAKPLAALITFKGREILMKTKTMVENMGLEVIYGDTDSIMINTNCDDYEKCHQIGGKIQTEINSLYKLLEIEIDGVFKRMLLLKKKKYACLTVKGDNVKSLKYNKEIKGLDIVRRDWSVLAKKAGEMVIEEILSLNNNSNDIIEKIHNYLRDLGEKIKNNEIPVENYVISKQLTKNPEDYRDRKGLSHVSVALFCNTSGKFEKKFRAGDTVPYVICLKEQDDDDFNKLTNTQRAFHPEVLRDDNNLKVDTKYYLSQQVYPVVSRLIDPLEGTDRYLVAEFLGIEDCVENKARQVNIELDALVVDDKSRFDTCKSAVFQCTNCKKEFEIRDAFVGEFNKEEIPCFTLEKCPHCHHIFNDDCIIKLKNQLLCCIRAFISDYYNNWMICEDPVCGHKSRAFTGPMAKRGPLCPQCSDSVLIPEITDLQVYLQIEFFCHLFNLQSYVDKFKTDEIKYAIISKWQKTYDEFLKIVLSFKASLEFNTIDLTTIFQGTYFQIAKKQ